MLIEVSHIQVTRREVEIPERCPQCDAPLDDVNIQSLLDEGHRATLIEGSGGDRGVALVEKGSAGGEIFEILLAECPDCQSILAEGAYVDSDHPDAKELKLQIEVLKERQKMHLQLIERLSMEAIPPEEASQLRDQIGALIAEVGTLRSEVWKLRRDRALRQLGGD